MRAIYLTWVTKNLGIPVSTISKFHSHLLVYTVIPPKKGYKLLRYAKIRPSLPTALYRPSLAMAPRRFSTNT